MQFFYLICFALASVAIAFPKEKEEKSKKTTVGIASTTGTAFTTGTYTNGTATATRSATPTYTAFTIFRACPDDTTLTCCDLTSYGNNPPTQSGCRCPPNFTLLPNRG